MTIYLIDIHHDTHTCPGGSPAANPSHAFDTRRTLVDVTDTGDCLTPVTIRIGGQTTEIPCGRHEPHDRQCRHCRPQVRVRHTTETHHGHHTPTALRANVALADDPCPRCGTPVMAFLGTHIGCAPLPVRQAA